MDNLELWQYLALGLIFVWGGFVRSGLGFGGATLTMPLLLMVVDSPVLVLPIIAVHLLIFGGLTLGGNLGNVDWAYLRRTLIVMAPGKAIGVLGLLSMPTDVLAAIIYAVTAFYALIYIAGRELNTHSRWGDWAMLTFGAYMSGTSLIGAPMIIAVYARHVPRHQLRETLFMLWIVLVLIKLAAFVATGTDLQLIHQLWLLPCAAIGHMLGLRLHKRLVSLDQRAFMRVMGFVLLALTAVSALSTYLR